jgi:CHAT domain-containing protein
MGNSHAVQVRAPCSRCGHKFVAEVWMIIDVSERPDLLKQVQEGTLHLAFCPECNHDHKGELDSTLLLYCPGETPTLIFSRGQRTSVDQDIQLAGMLLTHLQKSLGATWQDAWLEFALVVSPNTLPDLLTTDPDIRRRPQESAEQYVQTSPMRQFISDFVITPDEFQSELHQATSAEQQYQDAGDAVALDRAIGAWQRIMTHRNFSKAPTRFQARVLDSAAYSLTSRYERQSQLEDLQKAIILLEKCVAVVQRGFPKRSNYLINLGYVLHKRFEQMGDVADLDHANFVWQQALQDLSPNSLNKIGILSNLAVGLHKYYAHTGNLSDLDKAIKTSQQLLELLPAGSSNHADAVANLAILLVNNYAQTNDLTVLKKAIAISLQELATLPSDDPSRSAILSNLGVALIDRYRHLGDSNDLAQAIETHQKALELAPPSSPDRARILYYLGSALHERCDWTGSPEDIEQAASNYTSALQLVSPKSPERADMLNGFGTALHAQYVGTGNSSYLEQAISTLSEALALTPLTSPNRISCLHNLGSALDDHYERTGNPEDIKQALSVFQQALQLISSTARDRARLLDSLGTALINRYSFAGNLADLVQAADYHQQAVSLMPTLHSGRAGYLNNLGRALRALYSHTGDQSELDRAISTLEEALRLTTSDSRVRGSIFTNLGSAKTERFHRIGDLLDLDNAIFAFKQALLFAPPSSFRHSKYLGNLASGLRERYAQTGDLGDLEKVIEYAQRALEEIAPTVPMRATYLHILSSGLQSRYSHIGDPIDLVQAKKYWREACETGLRLSPATALRSSRTWGDSAFGQDKWLEAIEAFGYGIKALDELLRSQLLREGKEAWLREAQGLPAHAAYATARVSNLPAAVTTLELGRARLLSDALERDRADLENLKTIGYDEFFQIYQSAAQRITRLDSSELRLENLPANYDLVAELHRAYAELTQVIDAIRQVPGYEDFFGAPTFEQVRRTLATAGSVGVYVMVTSVGGLALIVHAGGVKEVWLDLKEDEVDAWLLKRDGKNVIGGYLVAQLTTLSLDAELHQILPLLSDKVMRPVSEALKSLSASEVMLIPCGRLALFPLHAAEYRVDGQVRCFMDEFTVTYTPSARALGSCREALAAVADQSPTLVGVGNPLPLPEGANTLIYARPEVEEIAPLFSQAFTLLYEQQATREALDAQLGQTTYLHLSCHGTFNAQDPLESGVVLSNGEMLALKDLLGGQRLRGTRLVVLSACQTAITDFNDLPEEAVGLPGGFVQAGVPGMVGTLWPVNDLSTMLLMVKFYEAHLKEGLAPAAALRKAQLWLRDVTNEELSELFAKYKLTATDRPTSTRMAYEMASEKFREHTLRDPNERPYAHPYYWAPFVFYGV